MLAKRRDRIEELKCLSVDALNEEGKKYDIDSKIYPITIVEYFKSDAFLEKTFLNKVAVVFSLARIGGYFSNETGECFVFVDKGSMGKNNNIYSDFRFGSLVFVSFHEFKHRLQALKKGISLSDDIIITLEDAIKQDNPYDYKKRHDQYFMEIDANLYSVEKTTEFLCDKYPDVYNSVKDFIENYKILGNFYLNCYDYQELFDRFYLICKENKVSLQSVSGIDLFFTDVGGFKSVREIMNSEKLKLLDDRVAYGILGSKAFLSHIYNSFLDDEEKKFMYGVLSDILRKEVCKIDSSFELYHKGAINSKEYLDLSRSSLGKTDFLGNMIRTLGLYKINECEEVKK